MPLYEYKCRTCGKEYEEEKSITDTLTPACAACHSTDTYRLISKTSFVLRGGGWYRDGYS